jgi:hypothetical protein
MGSVVGHWRGAHAETATTVATRDKVLVDILKN